MSVPGLVFDPRPARMVLPAVAGRLRGGSRLPGTTPLRLLEVDEPVAPGPDWVLLRPRHVGICGSDVVQAFVRVAWDNPLSALVSFPHVIGHEIVAEVVDGGSEAGPAPGALVAVDPWLGCEVRTDARPCPACAAGRPPLCRRHREPVLADRSGMGMHLGHVAGLPGGMTSLMVAHRRRLHPLPAGLDPAVAVLADPMAVGCHAVDRAEVGEGPVLVLGAGTIGLCTVAVLRRRHPRVEVLVTASWPHLADEVRLLGAIPIPVDPAAAVEAVAERLGGGAVLRPLRGGPWIAGDGVEVAVDTIGSPGTMETALRAVRPRGRVVSVGVSRPRRTETTLVYAKEIEVAGSNGYGRSERGRDHIDEALDLLDGGAAAPRRWLTSQFPLSRWREAFRVAADPGLNRSIKVTLTP